MGCDAAALLDPSHEEGQQLRAEGEFEVFMPLNVSLGQVAGKQHGGDKEQTAGTHVVRTQRGFLNIHSSPGNPFRTDNIVGYWQEGDLVQVTGPSVETSYGPWLPTER